MNGKRITTDYGFETWMRRVNAVVVSKTGCSVHDMPDCCFRDWYDDGMGPVAAAKKAIRNARDE